MTQLQSLVASVSVLSLLSVADAWSPTNSYAPAKVNCDGKTGLTREAGKISDAEASWLTKRDPITSTALKSFLDRVTSNFEDNSIVEKSLAKLLQKLVMLLVVVVTVVCYLTLVQLLLWMKGLQVPMNTV